MVGDPFDVELAAAAAALDPAAVPTALDELLRRDLVRSTDQPRAFRFRHPLVRTARPTDHPGGWRLGAHERAAAALAALGAAPAARAGHLERSARHGDRVAAGVLRQAGAAAAHRAPASAARWFTAALRLLPPSGPAAERIELLSARAAALAATGQFAGSRAALLESLALTPDSAGTTVRLTAACAAVEHLLGRSDEAHRHLIDALAAVSDPPRRRRSRWSSSWRWTPSSGWTGRRCRAGEPGSDGRGAAGRAAAAGRGGRRARPGRHVHRGHTGRAGARGRGSTSTACRTTLLARRLDAAVHLAGATPSTGSRTASGTPAGQLRSAAPPGGHPVPARRRLPRLQWPHDARAGSPDRQVLDAAVEAARLSVLSAHPAVPPVGDRAGLGGIDRASAAARKAVDSARGLGGGPLAAFAAMVLAGTLLPARCSAPWRC